MMNDREARCVMTLLKDVSRSFYLTLRVLPSAIAPQIGLAYLLARATDTIADTDAQPVARRLEMLGLLRRRIEGSEDTSPALAEALSDFNGPAARPVGGAISTRTERGPTLGEEVLLRRLDEVVAGLNRFSQADQRRIREVLAIITSGQELDLRRFGSASGGRIIALASEVELEDYTYRVAGCVGEFWTHMCRAHLFPNDVLNDAGLLADAVRFGKGLQLVNILRDLPADLRQGRCYLPEQELVRLHLKPSDLLDPAQEAAFRPLFEAWLSRARGYLEAGWRYTNCLPRRCLRVRLACAWPVLIGIKTLARLRQHPVLQPAHRVKITRGEVRSILWRTLFWHPWPKAWGGLFLKLEREVRN